MSDAAFDLDRFKHYPPPETVPNGKFTYGDYKRWDLKPHERVEVIYGMAYIMAAPNVRHQDMLGALHLQIGNFLEEKRRAEGTPCKVRMAPYDVRLFYKEDETDDTVVQPDLAVVCDKSKDGEEACHGAPELVVEILSPSNSATEMKRKFEIYQKAGVREYWVVDPKTNSVDVYLFFKDTFTLKKYDKDDKLPSAVLTGLEINLADVFAA
jgi:Uma2 family endonuclease